MCRSLNQVASFQPPYRAVACRSDMQSSRPPMRWRNEWQPNVYAPIRSDVDRQDDAADADAELAVLEERLPRVGTEDRHDDRSAKYSA